MEHNCFYSQTKCHAHIQTYYMYKHKNNTSIRNIKSTENIASMTKSGEIY
jgi:hypothetical protein